MVSFFSSYTSDLACCPIFVTLGLECIARYTKVREVKKAAAVQLLLVLPWLHPSCCVTLRNITILIVDHPFNT